MARITNLQNEIAKLQAVLAERNAEIAKLNKEKSERETAMANLVKEFTALREQKSAKAAA